MHAIEMGELIELNLLKYFQLTVTYPYKFLRLFPKLTTTLHSLVFRNINNERMDRVLLIT